MSTSPIADASDPRLDPFRDLTRPRTETMVVEGLWSVERLIAAGHLPLRILTTPESARRLAAVPAAVPREVVASTILREVVGFAFHRGVLALAPRPAYCAPRDPRTVVVAERVTDPSNIGALIRNCRALHADTLWLTPTCGDPFSRKAIRASMGQAFFLPIRQAPLEALLADLAEPAWRRLAATCSPSAMPLHEAQWPTHTALFIGNEGFGLSPELQSRTHAQVRIPLHPDVDSLNVAAATAILLHHRMSQIAPGATPARVANTPCDPRSPQHTTPPGP